jgi:hypothetical protein
MCRVTNARAVTSMGLKEHNPAYQDTSRRLSPLCQDTTFLGWGAKQVEQRA